MAGDHAQSGGQRDFTETETKLAAAMEPSRRSRHRHRTRKLASNGKNQLVVGENSGLVRIASTLSPLSASAHVNGVIGRTCTMLSAGGCDPRRRSWLVAAWPLPNCKGLRSSASKRVPRRIPLRMIWQFSKQVIFHPFHFAGRPYHVGHCGDLGLDLVLAICLAVATVPGSILPRLLVSF